MSEAIASGCAGSRFREKIRNLLHRRAAHLQVFAGRANQPLADLMAPATGGRDGRGESRLSPVPSALHAACVESVEIVERLWPYADAENERQLLTALYYGLGRPFGWSDSACRRLIEKMESRAAEFPDSCFNTDSIARSLEGRRYDVPTLMRLRPYVQTLEELEIVDALIVSAPLSASAESVDELIREKLVARAVAEPSGPKRPFLPPLSRVAAA